MGGQRSSFRGLYEPRGYPHTHADPINLDPYQQPYREQDPFSVKKPDDFDNSFSQRQITGEKLVPQHNAFRLGASIKLIPPACILLLLLFALLGGGRIFKDIVFASTTQTQQLFVNQSARIIIRDDYGQVHVHGGDASTVTVRSTQNPTSWNLQANSTNVDARVVDDGYVALIGAVQPDGKLFQPGQRVDLDITVPNMASLQVIAPQGAVSVDGVDGG
jgi:hypothetical protein